jgi:hypothetical protein
MTHQRDELAAEDAKAPKKTDRGKAGGLLG